MLLPSVTVTVTVVGGSADGVMYALALDEPLAEAEVEVELEAVALAAAWKALNECGFGSAGALMAKTMPIPCS